MVNNLTLLPGKIKETFLTTFSKTDREFHQDFPHANTWLKDYATAQAGRVHPEIIQLKEGH
jgi:hypothetical protein